MVAQPNGALKTSPSDTRTQPNMAPPATWISSCQKITDLILISAPAILQHPLPGVSCPSRGTDLAATISAARGHLLLLHQLTTKPL